MTNTTAPIALTFSSADLHTRIATLLAELTEASKDLALMKRLKLAEANVERLATELDETRAMLPAIIADEYAAQREAMFSGIHSVSVTDKGKAGEHVLHKAFSITVKRIVTEFATGDNLLTDFTYNGFEVMPQETYLYLLERQPSAIPSSIMTLAPNDPQAAFAIYFAGKRRGYLSA